MAKRGSSKGKGVKAPSSESVRKKGTGAKAPAKGSRKSSAKKAGKGKSRRGAPRVRPVHLADVEETKRAGRRFRQKKRPLAGTKEGERHPSAPSLSDPDGFVKLVKKYQNLVFRYVYNTVRDYHLTQDLTQEIFVKVYKNFFSYNSRYPFSTWLLKVAHNHSIDYLRRKRLETISIESPAEGGSLGDTLQAAHPPASALFEAAHRKERIQKAVFSLPVDYRSVIVLRYLDGVKLEEIAWILEVPVGTVKSRINRARQLLQSWLGKASMF